MLNRSSPSKTPFIKVGNEDEVQSDGPISPFHAMDDDGNELMMVKASPSDFSVSNNINDQEFEEGILMLKMSGNKNTTSVLELPIGLDADENDKDDDDNDSTYSTLKVHQGSADFDYDIKSVSQSKWEFGKSKRAIIKTFYLSIFAMLGALLRIVLAQLFGEECKNPGTVGWLKSGQPLCVTADGDTSIAGGIIFADFPANLLGSFIMGFMQSGDTMDLPKSIPIAWLNENHRFQSDFTIHFAIMTGFCGSLTTFSSWNSEMVMMLLGEDADRGSLIFRALFGYFIGVETCMASFILGKNVARYIFSYVNPALHVEALEMERIKQYGIYVNTELSDFERRFLSGFDMGKYEIKIDSEAVEHLEKWKVSTESCRRHGHPLLPLLTDVEYQTMVLDEPLRRDHLIPSVDAEWNIEALENWVYVKRKVPGLRGCNTISSRDFKLLPAMFSFFVCFSVLFFSLVYMDSNEAYEVTSRTMVYAGLIAPLGAFLRWRLSKLNGTIQRYNWFPLGTFTANVIGSIFSLSMVGLESHLYSATDFWSLGTVRALKIGFSGSLSTVSTYVAEASVLLKSQHPLRGYMYIIVSIVTSAILGGIAFSIIHVDLDDAYY